MIVNSGTLWANLKIIFPFTTGESLSVADAMATMVPTAVDSLMFTAALGVINIRGALSLRSMISMVTLTELV